MVFVPGYEHDIFVSYAHVDDQPLPGAEQGWITTLIDGLKNRLGANLGRMNAYSLVSFRLARLTAEPESQFNGPVLLTLQVIVVQKLAGLSRHC